MRIYQKISERSSEMVTHAYSTSFSLGIKMMREKYRNPVYAIYGFVRLADEIVDTFHDHDQKLLFIKFREDTMLALKNRISINPVLNNFQQVVHRYSIDRELIGHFFHSMEMDLNQKTYTRENYERYVLGSAEVVGLMCLMVFLDGDRRRYEELKPYAKKLGSAYQKINFLRDLKADYHHLGRIYFPDLDMNNFSAGDKKEIEKEIEKEFSEGYAGIRKLPPPVKLGVYLSYVYYHSLFRKIKQTPAEKLISLRVRIPNGKKYLILLVSYCKCKLSMI